MTPRAGAPHPRVEPSGCRRTPQLEAKGRLEVLSLEQNRCCRDGRTASVSYIERRFACHVVDTTGERVSQEVVDATGESIYGHAIIRNMAVPRISKRGPVRMKIDDATTAPVLVDVRLKYPYEHSTVMLPGAVRVAPPDFDLSSVPRDREDRGVRFRPAGARQCTGRRPV